MIEKKHGKFEIVQKCKQRTKKTNNIAKFKE